MPGNSLSGNFVAAYANKDWVEIERLTHKMKYTYQYLERYLKAWHFQLAKKLYQQLLSSRCREMF